MKYFHCYVEFTKSDILLSGAAAVILSSVIFLACKATESLRTIRDVLCVVSKVLDDRLSIKELDAVNYFELLD